MTNELPVEIFDSLYRLARAEGVGQTYWADSSNTKQPRIADLAARKIPFSLRRLEQLVPGLKKQIGRELVDTWAVKILKEYKHLPKTTRLLMGEVMEIDEDFLIGVVYERT